MRKVIIKLGGSVITKKSATPPQIKKDELYRLVQEIAKAYHSKPFQLIIVHGAGCFGHIPAKKFQMTASYWHEDKKQGSIVIRQLMEELNSFVVKAFCEHDIPTIAFQASVDSLVKNDTLVQFPTQSLQEYIQRGLVPVTYGDIVLDDNSGINILSGDQIICFIAKHLKLDQVIIGTDVDGVFDQDPKKNPQAHLIPEIIAKDFPQFLELSGSCHTDVTGGMLGKIQQLVKLAQNSGVSSHVVNAKQPQNIYKALLQMPCQGTKIYQ